MFVSNVNPTILINTKNYTSKNLSKKNTIVIDNSQKFFHHNSYYSPAQISFKGTLDFPGYPKEKKQIMEDLIKPIKDTSGTLEAPAIYLLYANDYSNPEKIYNGIISNVFNDKEKCVTHFKAFEDDFISGLYKELNKAREEYLKTSRRSVLVIPDIEKYISATNYDNVIKDLQLNPNDFKNYKYNKDNVNNIAALKHIADYCSKIPKSKNDSGAALTILALSKHPYLIDHELLRRPEKLQIQMFPITDPMIYADTLKEILNVSDSFISQLKLKSKQEIEEIDYYPYKVREALLDLKSKNKLKDIKIDYKKIPTDVIAEIIFYDAEERGLFTLEQLPKLVQEATHKYYMNSEKSFVHHLLKSIQKLPRNITPQYIKKEKLIRENLMMEKEIFDNNEVNIKDLLLDYESELISKKEINKFIEKYVDNEVSSIVEGKPLDDVDESVKSMQLYQDLRKDYIVSRIDKLLKDRYRFSYGNDFMEYVDLYLGGFGHQKDVLWVNTDDISKINIVRHFINEIKAVDVFEDVKYLEFPYSGHGYLDVEGIKMTRRITQGGLPIYQTKL